MVNCVAYKYKANVAADYENIIIFPQASGPRSCGFVALGVILPVAGGSGGSTGLGLILPNSLALLGVEHAAMLVPVLAVVLELDLVCRDAMENDPQKILCRCMPAT